MDRRRDLAFDAMAGAMQVRQEAGARLVDAIDIFDLAENRGVEVRFVDIPSMEGMYRKQSPPTILVSAHRPPGRQAFTVAHKLGHHYFKHATCIDELLANRAAPRSFQPGEYLADCFAGFLLMPKSTVGGAFARRGWDPAACTAEQTYVVAGWLGVGYTTLVHHMAATLRLMPQAHAAALAKADLKRVRRSILGIDARHGLVVVDLPWAGRAIDIQVGDVILVGRDVASSGTCVLQEREGTRGTLFVGVAPGVGQLHDSATGWSSYVRVRRRPYIGRSIFRHLEDPDDEDVSGDH